MSGEMIILPTAISTARGFALGDRTPAYDLVLASAQVMGNTFRDRANGADRGVRAPASACIIMQNPLHNRGKTDR